MPKHVQTQTLTITFTNLRAHTPEELISQLLDGHDYPGATYGLTASAVEVEEIETDAERSQREAEAEAEELTAQREAEETKRKRDVKLLELKGWLYGEHLKQEAGLPSEWDQGNWGEQTACGTSACIAGKTVLEAGGKFVKMIYGEGWNDPDTFRDPEPGEEVVFTWATMPNGETSRISDTAQELLGLTQRERAALFEGDNTYEMAAAVIDAIIDGNEDPYEARNRAR